MRIPGANVGLLAHNTCSLVKIGLSDNLYQFFLRAEPVKHNCPGLRKCPRKQKWPWKQNCPGKENDRGFHEIVQGGENVEEYGNNCTTMIGDIKTPGEAKNSGR